MSIVTTTTIITALVAIVATSTSIALYIALRTGRKKAARRMDCARREWQREQQDTLAALKQKMLGSMNRELQEPMMAIINPLQAIKAEPLPAAARNSVAEALSHAQSLMKRLNMLLDFHYTEADTDFTFSLPESAEQKAAYATMSVDDSNAGLAANAALERTADETASEDKHKFTMLMVDDAPDMCRFARDYFSDEYNVITASDGEQALEKLREEDRVDLVVSDIIMPKMDGLELCRIIKTDLNYSHIPVILLTGRTENETEMQGLKLGADDYITKPFNAETLRLRVKKFIEMKQTRLRQFRESEDVAAATLTTTDVDKDFLQQVIKIVDANMSNTNFTVETLGEQLEMSRTYLYKKIINITGKGPGEFIRTLRMKRGKQLLERGQMQVAEVAAAVGYNTPKRFTENFKQEYEMTPTEYQRKMRSGN